MGKDVLFEKLPPFGERFTHNILALQYQQIKDEEVQWHSGAMVLQLVKGRFSALIQRHYLTVNDGFVWHGCESLRDAGISNREVVIVTGAKLDLSAGFDGKSAVAIHLEL